MKRFSLTGVKRTLIVGVLTMIFGCGGDDQASSKSCAPTLVKTLRACAQARLPAVQECLGNGQCGALSAALKTLEGELRGACDDQSYGLLTQDALVERLQTVCSTHTDALAWRVLGGPHSSVWKGSDDKGRACLQAAYDASATMLDESLALYENCAASGTCDVPAIQTQRSALAKAASDSINAVCGTSLSSRIAVKSQVLAERVADQADCMVAATAAPDNALQLRCGPGHTQFEGKRGEWVKVDVDSDEWGTLCGDGSAYAFYVRLAPEGQPLDRVFVGLQGGGVCVFEDDCKVKQLTSPGLFTAQDDLPLGIGIASDDPKLSPFGDWTKVYLPYCNQDVFAGGGVTEEMGEVTLPRYGSVNLRAAMRMVRDVLWKRLDAEQGPGWRPDQVKAFVGGWSAGSYGTLYNYHWFLDDLRWPNTTAFPDAGMALDNGELLGVKGLGQVKIPLWGTLKQLPPYCFAGDCAVGPVLLKALSPRLKMTP
ncbi:MAG TPA: hypothetical protein DCQ06_14385, partial [Myxococcales bacterium]|nr:hypothetical protein [Myxococcales bacterium]